MSAGVPHWWTRITALVARGETGFDRRRGSGPASAGRRRRTPDVAPDVADDVGGGDERERRDDDLVAGPDAGEHEREVQRGRARRRGDRLRRADPAANASSKRPTRGPWATQPDATASAAASASSGPRPGPHHRDRRELLRRADRGRHAAVTFTASSALLRGARRAAARSDCHQLDEPAQPVFERRPRARSRAGRGAWRGRRRGAAPG